MRTCVGGKGLPQLQKPWWGACERMNEGAGRDVSDQPGKVLDTGRAPRYGRSEDSARTDFDCSPDPLDGTPPVGRATLK